MFAVSEVGRGEDSDLCWTQAVLYVCELLLPSVAREKKENVRKVGARERERDK